MPAAPELSALTLSRATVVVDAQLVDSFLKVFTGGATGLPGMAEAQQAAIVTALLEGNVMEAAGNARDYLLSEGITHFAGSSAAAFLTAVELGETLGRATHQWMGEARLQAEFDRLGGLTGLAAWPRSYRAAMDEGFLGPVLDTRIRPVALWLRELEGGADAPMSVAYYENRAYHLMVSMRDLELGYRRFGLEGAERTPDALSAALDAELRQAAAEALGQREALIWMNEVMRAEFARREAEREVAESAAEVQASTDPVIVQDATAVLRQHQAALDAAREVEVAALVALDAARAAQLDIALLPPLPEAQPGMVTVDLIRTEPVGPDMTAFHIRLTNTSPAPIAAFRADLSAQRLPPGSGVAWGSDSPHPFLAAGQVSEMTIVGSGDIGAVILHLAAMGETVATKVFPVAHAAPLPAAISPPAPVPGEHGWIDLPTTFRGGGVSQTTLSVDALRLTTEMQCGVTLAIDGAGHWTLSSLCSGAQPVVGATDPEAGIITALTPYPLSDHLGEISGTVRVVNGQTNPGWLGDSLRETMHTITSPGYGSLHIMVDVTAHRISVTSEHDLVVQTGGRTPQQWHHNARGTIDLQLQP